MHLDTQRNPDGGWFDRFVRLVDEDGEVVEDFGEHPRSTNSARSSAATGSESTSGNKVSSATTVGIRSTTDSPPSLTASTLLGLRLLRRGRGEGRPANERRPNEECSERVQTSREEPLRLRHQRRYRLPSWLPVLLRTIDARGRLS